MQKVMKDLGNNLQKKNRPQQQKSKEQVANEWMRLAAAGRRLK